MPSATTNATILVVEDEAMIRLTSIDMLEEAGFRTLEAANADEALAILEDEPVALLFSDIDMPGSMDGLTLATKVHRRWPATRLLLTSGRHRLAEHDIPDHGSFVAKPFGRHDLMREIHDQLRQEA